MTEIVAIKANRKQIIDFFMTKKNMYHLYDS